MMTKVGYVVWFNHRPQLESKPFSPKFTQSYAELRARLFLQDGAPEHHVEETRVYKVEWGKWYGSYACFLLGVLAGFDLVVSMTDARTSEARSIL